MPPRSPQATRPDGLPVKSVRRQTHKASGPAPGPAKALGREHTENGEGSPDPDGHAFDLLGEDAEVAFCWGEDHLARTVISTVDERFASKTCP